MNPHLPSSRRARGFTLIEAIVALAILLIGVYAVLRIFPLGLSTVGYSRNLQVATRLAEQEVKRVLAAPANLPLRIVATNAAGVVVQYDPDDLVYSEEPYSAGQAGVTNGSPDVSGSGTQWLTATAKVLPGCLFGVAGSDERYLVTSVEADDQLTLDRPFAGSSGTVDYRIERPSWEPDALFLPRTIVGETVEIPRQAPPAPPGSGALVPKHLLAFGPILPLSKAMPAVVYSTRYTAVNDPTLLSTGQDRFQYVIDSSTGVLTFDSVPYARSFKVDYSWVQRAAGAGAKTITSKVDELFTLAANANSYTLAGIGSADQQLVPGSERVYRTFAYNPSGTPGPGEFSMTQVGRLLGVVQFSPDDALSTVLVDYRTADWQIMHEDKRVGDDGLARLSVAPLRSAAYRNEPRQPVALFVDWPNQHDVVAVDLESGEALYGAIAVQAFGSPDAAGYVGTFSVTYPGSDGRIRDGFKEGVLRFDDGSLATPRIGRSYRIFYRAVEDWGVRVSKAADRYYEGAGLGAAADQVYSRANGVLSFPFCERGKSVMVDYTYQPSGAASTDPYRRVSGELHTVPATGQADAGIIRLRIAAGDTVIAVNKVVGSSLTATTVWANNRRRSASKQNIPLQEKVARRAVETFAASSE